MTIQQPTRRRRPIRRRVAPYLLLLPTLYIMLYMAGASALVPT